MQPLKKQMKMENLQSPEVKLSTAQLVRKAATVSKLKLPNRNVGKERAISQGKQIGERHLEQS